MDCIERLGSPSKESTDGLHEIQKGFFPQSCFRTSARNLFKIIGRAEPSQSFQLCGRLVVLDMVIENHSRQDLA